MNKILLISESTLKKLSNLGANLDGLYLYPSICLAQDVDLTNLIGNALVNKLCDLVGSGDIEKVENEAYKTLLDTYVTNYLVWAVTAAIVPIINYKWVNAGVSVNTDEHRRSLEYSSAKNLQAQVEKYANAYAVKMKDYLRHNSSLFPEYCKMMTCEGAGAPQLCGIVFDERGVI